MAIRPFDGESYAESTTSIGCNRVSEVLCRGLLRTCFPGSRFEKGEAEIGPRGRSNHLIYLVEIGAGEGIRTLDPDLGKDQIGVWYGGAIPTSALPIIHLNAIPT